MIDEGLAISAKKSTFSPSMLVLVESIVALLNESNEELSMACLWFTKVPKSNVMRLEPPLSPKDPELPWTGTLPYKLGRRK